MTKRMQLDEALDAWYARHPAFTVPDEIVIGESFHDALRDEIGDTMGLRPERRKKLGKIEQYRGIPIRVDPHGYGITLTLKGPERRTPWPTR